MSTVEIVVLVLVLLAVAAVVAVLMAQAKKRKHLQSRFGPEYDRTVEGSGKRREAERELAEREERRRSLDIRPLPEQDRRAFAERWRSTQADFVDHPELAVRSADLLVAEVMGRRGYPVGDFDQMSRDVSVDHAGTVDEYRAAHQISELNDRKQATTEQLRQAMVHYRALFTELLGEHQSAEHRSAEHRDDTSRRDDTPYRDDSTHRDDDRGGRRDVGYATDEDRRADPVDANQVDIDRADTGRVDTSRADGVRVERGGLDRGRGGTEFEHDLPRDERPRA